MKKYIKQFSEKLKSSGDGKVLLSNFAYLSILQIVSYVFPFLTLPYLARVIGVESFGKIAFASAIVVWFQTITEWGFNFTATRDIAVNRKNKDYISFIFSNVIWAKLVLLCISFFLLLIAIIAIPEFKKHLDIILITFLIIPGNIIFPEWFFQAIERMKYITLLNVLSKTFFTIAVFVFIKEKSDYLLQPLLISLGSIVSGIIAMYLIIFRWNYKLLKPNWRAITITIKGSTDVFLNTMIPNLYNSFSTLLLGFFGGNISNGLLDAGNRFIFIGHKFMEITGRVFFPFLSRKIEKHDFYVKLTIIIAGSLSILLFLFAPLLINLFFTAEFFESIIVLRILSFSVFLIAIRNAYGTHFLILRGYEKELRNLTFIGSFTGFLSAFPLIIYYDYIGAAITILIAQIVMAIMVILKARKIKKLVF